VTNAFVRLFRSGVLLAVVGLAAGCVMTIATDPNAYPVAASDVPALPSGTQVEIVNSYPSSYMARMDGNQQADLHEFTQTAVVALGRALASKGVVVGGGKKIVLEVSGVTRAQGFGMLRTSVSLQAELGAAKVTAWGEAAGMDPSRDFSAAITHAVEELMHKPELREYLTRR
jgi:hypothetical protein